MKHEGGEFLLLDGQMLSAEETLQVIEELRTRIAVMQVQMIEIQDQLRDLRELAASSY